MKGVATAEIPLMRGGEIVSTLTGAFGQSLRETRLTALLGYLIALVSLAISEAVWLHRPRAEGHA